MKHELGPCVQVYEDALEIIRKQGKKPYYSCNAITKAFDNLFGCYNNQSPFLRIYRRLYLRQYQLSQLEPHYYSIPNWWSNPDAPKNPRILALQNMIRLCYEAGEQHGRK
jgi:hypothetical protein